MTNSSVGKILVVDDEVELKNALVEVLASQGYEASGFTSGEEALAALRTKAFDILLTDLMMPGMDGIALVTEALQIDPHLVAIVMTGQGTIQTAVDAMKVGAFDYVLKPFRLQTVLPVLTRAMNTRHMRLENLQLRETVGIYELSQTIAFTLDRQTIVSKLADAALQQSDADEVSILFPTEDGEELYVAAVRGENRQRLLGERVPLQESISSWVVHERTPLILDGEVNDKRFRALWPRPEICSAISIPMQIANKLIGTININALDRARPFTLGQMKALTILASTAAAALESASLYAKVRKTEEEYRSIFENAVEGIFRSVDRRFTRVNPALAQIFGYDSPEEMVAEVTDIAREIYVNPEDQKRSEELEEQNGLLNGFVFEARRRNGEKIWVSLNRRSIFDEDGVRLYREGTLQDISGRKQAEEKVRQSERQMAEAQHLAHVGSWNWDLTNDILTWSDEHYHILGVDPKEFDPTYDSVVAEYVVPDDRDLVRSVIDGILENHEPFSFHYRIRRPDEEVRVVHSQGSLLCDEQGEPIRMFGTAQDVTERKRAEEERERLAAEIESQRQRLDSIVGSVPGVVWEAWGQPDEATQRINFVSDYVETMLGYSVDKWLATPNFWLTITHPSDRDRASQLTAAAFAAGQPGTIEFRWLAKDGRAIWVESNFVVIKNDEGQPVGLRGVTTDISERKRAQATESRRAVHALFRADVSAALASSTSSLRDTLQLCAEAMVLHLNAAFARVWTFNRENSMLELRASAGIYTDIDGGHARVPLGSFKIGHIAANRIPHISNSVLSDPEVSDKLWAQREQMVAFAGYPLIVEDRLLGVMAMFSREVLEDDTLDALASVADIVSQGIERQRTAAALRESEERYRELFESNPYPMWVFDLETLRFLAVNDAAVSHYGYSRQEFLKLTIAEIRPSEDVPQLMKDLANEPAGGITASRHCKKDGTVIEVEISSQKLVFGNQPAQLVLALDITARKKAEAALRESEERYKGLVDSAFDGVVIHQHLTIISANRAYAEMFGYTVDELIGRAVLDLTPPEHHHFVESQTTRDQTLYETIGLKKDGTHINIEVSAKNCFYEGGRARLAAVRDITERKWAEEQLRRQLDFTEAITSSLGEGLYALDRKGRVTFMNPAAEAALGWTQEELQGRNMHEVIHFQHADGTPRPADECPLLGVIRSGQSYNADSDVFTRKDGTLFAVSYNSSPILTNEQLEGAVLAFHDITERQQAERALRESEERYRDLVENAHDIIYTHDLEGNYTSINKAGAMITGYTVDEALRLNLAGIVAPEFVDRAREMLKRKVAGERVTAYELDLIAKDGRRITVEANTKLFYQDGIPVGVQGIARDVTERKLLEAQLRQSQKMEAIGQLAGGVAHDFNNLLTAINGYSSLALQRTNEREPIRGYLEEIKKAGDRAANLTRQLLAFGRKQMLQPVALSLNDVVADLNEMLRRLIGEDIRLTSKFDPALKKIKADAGQIEQVIVNLVVNARDAMPHGGNLTIETGNFELDGDYASNHVGVRPGSYAMLAVSDTGVGMDDETRARIFEPFFTTKEQGKGTGLGLSTVYGIVKQSGGNIWVYSEPNQGTVFKVYLPQLRDASEPTETAAVETPVPGGSETILLVEDEDVVRSLAQEVLEQAGYRVFSVSGGNEALRVFQESAERIDLLLTDVVMPEMSGKELAERLADLRPAMRVLFMSGYTDEAIVHHGIVDSNVQFIQKPFSPDSLAKKIREVLD